MATFLAIVRTDDDLGFIASFADFSGCVVAASTLDGVLAKAKETLVKHLENLLAANQEICVPTSFDAIERGDALLLAAIEVPDDLRIVNVELAIPALSLVQIDSFARRHGLSRDALFVQAVGRWAAQEVMPIERRGQTPEGPTLFDFGNPLELKVDCRSRTASDLPAFGPAFRLASPPALPSGRRPGRTVRPATARGAGRKNRSGPATMRGWQVPHLRSEGHRALQWRPGAVHRLARWRRKTLERRSPGLLPAGSPDA